MYLSVYEMFYYMVILFWKPSSGYGKFSYKKITYILFESNWRTMILVSSFLHTTYINSV